jgi:3-oxoacyl-(acyl-carrier-protein) synthase
MGIICPTGNTVDEAWRNAASGKTGIGPITRFDASHLENRFGGEVRNFDPDAFLGRREARRTDRVTQLALYAAEQAIHDSGLQITPENMYDIGVIVGTGIGGVSSLFASTRIYLERGAKAVSPLLVPMMASTSPTINSPTAASPSSTTRTTPRISTPSTASSSARSRRRREPCAPLAWRAPASPTIAPTWAGSARGRTITD